MQINTYAKNGFDSSGYKVLVFLVEVTSKTDASKDEDDVEEDGPVSQHGHDQGKGEAAKDTAEKDKREEFCCRQQKSHLLNMLWRAFFHTFLLPGFEWR